MLYRISVRRAGVAATFTVVVGLTLSLVMSMSTLASAADAPKWLNLFDGKSPPTVAPQGTLPLEKNAATFKDGVLHLVDGSTATGSTLLYVTRWNADPKEAAECEGELKLIAASAGPCGMCIDVANGVHQEDLSFYPDRIELGTAKLSYKMNTTGDFHTYRVRIAGNDIQVFVDGKLAIEGQGKFTCAADNARNVCEFGAGSSSATGEAVWRRMRCQYRAPAQGKIVVPEIPGLDVKLGETIVIVPDSFGPVATQFADGRLTVNGKWSTDGGHTWQNGPASPDKASIELKGGEVLSLGYATSKRVDGKYTLPQRRSLDGWKTVTAETGVLDIPRSVPCGGDDAGSNPGFLLEHSILRLKDGRLMATMYGTYEEDKTPAADPPYPASFHFNKYRTIVVFSSDKGRTWGDPVTVATAPKISQEGACEAGLARAANGDILCAMRSGGYPGARPTPCYLSRSTNEGKTWSKPQAILDLGVLPGLCVMRNGIVVCVTGRPGNWLVFSRDDGRTWQGGFCFSQGSWPSTSSYNAIFETAPDTIMVFYDREVVTDQGTLRREVAGTFFTVRKK